jgi:hypothetical protein
MTPPHAAAPDDAQAMPQRPDDESQQPPGGDSRPVEPFVSRLRDRLVALEIRARCEEWRKVDGRDAAARAALRTLQSELRRGIWQLGIRAALSGRARGRGAADACLLTELRAVSYAIRCARHGDASTLGRLATSLDAASMALDTVAPGAAPSTVYRRAASAGADAPSDPGSLSPSDGGDGGPARKASKPEIARGVAFVVLAWVGMGASAAGARWLAVAMAVLLVAWTAGLAARGRSFVERGQGSK